jgi:glycosyltransferase involved in cell wall biosynthesis
MSVAKPHASQRLLLLITDLQLGGTPTVVREIAVRLRKAGVDVEVACLSRWGPVADQIKSAGVPVTALGARGPGDWKVFGRLIRLIRKEHFTTVLSFLIHANAVASVASLRVPGVRWFQSAQTTQPMPRWHWKLQRVIHRRCEKLIVPSQSVADALGNWSAVPAEKIVIIPNAIDPADWADAQSSVPVANPRPYPITFLGRLDPIKDVPTLVSAAATLGGKVHLHIYGEGADRARIEERIRATGAAVTLHGAVESPQAVLRQSGMLVLPSLAEGFGLVLIEAMAAGVPVVASNVPGIRDVIQNQINGVWFPAGDDSSLAAVMEWVIDDLQLRGALIANAAEDVRRRFSWETVLPEYRRVLEV